MGRFSRSLTEVFEAYGDDADSALEAWANVDPEAWSDYCDGAAVRRYTADYAAFVRTLTHSVDREALKAEAGEARLFEVTEASAEFRMRERIRLEGREYALASLSGAAGAEIIRAAALRDRKAALTTIQRSAAQMRLADHIEHESDRLGRDVTAGEVLGWTEAA